MAKFMPRGNSKVWFAAAIADAGLAPTVAELTAAVDLTDEIAEANGFSVKGNTIDTPNLGSRQIPKIPGDISMEDSSFTFYLDTADDTIKTALPRDEEGFIVILLGSTSAAAGKKVDVFPVQVISNTNQLTTDNTAAKFQVDFAINEVPAEGVAILAGP